MKKVENVRNTQHYRVISLLAIATSISWAGWIVVVNKMDPLLNIQEVYGPAIALFYLSTFFSLSGTFSILLFFLKKWRTEDKIYIKHITISLRQGILLSICTTICMSLLMLDLLRVWNGLLIVFLMMLIEFYLSSKDDL